MKITIIGPGALGCLFASMLSESGLTVFLLDKDSERADYISANGISLEALDGVQKAIPVTATTDPSTIGISDFVCICVKAYDTAVSVEHISPLLGDETSIVSFQNGIGNVELIEQITGRRNILCASTSHGATALSNGHIRHAGKGSTRIASVYGEFADSARSFADVLAKAGIEAEIEKVTEINKIMEFGVMVTPAFAIDGEVKISGRVLSVDEIFALL